MNPLAIDLFCGLGGWTEGLLAEGYYVVGFDIERHDYGTGGYPAQLVLQDVLTLHGRQFRDAALIVASPPCQFFSYCAMPWSRAKALEAEVWASPERKAQATALFDACFRIQREAIEAAGHFIPLIVENVRGAQKWVGHSRWNYGSFHLFGDVPALMPMTKAVQKSNPDGTEHPPGSWFAIADSEKRGWQSQANGAPMRRDDSHKTRGMNWSNQELRSQDFTRIAGQQAMEGQKVPGFRFDGSGKSFQTASVEETGTKQGGDWFNAEQPSISRMAGSKSKARKAASAAIAKIPLRLARYIAAVYRPALAL